MSDRSPPLVGRHLLDRRGFLGHMASGMGGIALSALLAEQGLLASDAGAGGSKTAAAASNPMTPKPPHFPGRAKRVLHIFCTGAVSHLDTWDYKPELIKRHGQPMPGVEKLITFQGENGNLAQPLDVPPAWGERQVHLGPAAATWPHEPTTCASSTR